MELARLAAQKIMDFVFRRKDRAGWYIDLKRVSDIKFETLFI